MTAGPMAPTPAANGAAPADPDGRARAEDEAGHCTGCGRAAGVCGGCGRPLDPPRHCPRCGTRLRVAVTPTGFSARCRHHGPVG